MQFALILTLAIFKVLIESAGPDQRKSLDVVHLSWRFYFKNVFMVSIFVYLIRLYARPYLVELICSWKKRKDSSSSDKLAGYISLSLTSPYGLTSLHEMKPRLVLFTIGSPLLSLNFSKSFNKSETIFLSLSLIFRKSSMSSTSSMTRVVARALKRLD